MSIGINGGKKYGLTIPNKPKGKVVARASVFCDDDDDAENCEENASLTQSKAVKKVGTETVLKRKTQLEIDKALAEDPSVYEYDAIYEQLQESKAAKIPGAQKDKEKKPKYIHALMKTAEQRKKEYERRIERQVQKEREAEKGEFEDKETFVTSAYRKKMQEMAEEEEKEKRQAELEAKLDVTRQSDLSGFYRHLLKQTAGEEVVPDVTTVKTEPSNDENNTKETSSGIDFAADRDATDSDNSTSSDSSKSISKEEEKHSRRHKRQYRTHEKHRLGSISPEGKREKSVTPERNSSRTSRRQRHRSRTPDRQKHRSRTPERVSYRSRTPEKKRYRSRTPQRKRHRSRTPERRRHGSRTAEKDRLTSNYSSHEDETNSRKSQVNDEKVSPKNYHKELAPVESSAENAPLSVNQQEGTDLKSVNRVTQSISENAEETKAQLWSVKFAKRNVGETVEEAKARYLARRQNRVIAVAVEQD